MIRTCGCCRGSSTRSSRSARRSASGPDNFYLYGHSWGGLLAIEYALKYQQHLKGLVDLEHDGEHPRSTTSMRRRC